MHCVIRDRTNANVGGVAEHRDVRHKKQQRKLEPTSVDKIISREADDKYRRPFKMQERSRSHGALNPTRLATASVQVSKMSYIIHIDKGS